MEDFPIEKDCFEVAEMEERRARQSEFVNMQAVQLHHKLEALLGEQLTSCASAAAVAALPAEFVEAMEAYLQEYEAEMAQLEAAASRYEEEKERSAARATLFSEKAERLRSESAYYSEKNSANLKDFRRLLSQSGEAAKERHRELAAINRKREKAEMDIKRTDMELARLRKISKRTK